MKSICCLCGKDFSARHSYGLCTLCLSPVRLRELDRVESAIKQAQNSTSALSLYHFQNGSPTLSDYHGLCALCKKYNANRILMFDRSKGLIYPNIFPACAACEVHFVNGFDVAKADVQQYLSQQTLPNFIPSNEEEATPHVEYQQ